MGQVSTAEKLRGISLLPKLHQKTCYCKLFRKLHILGAKHSYFSENPFPLIVLWGSRWLCNSLTSDVGIIYIHYYFLMQSVHVWEKKILLMKKTLHIIELDVLNLTVLQWYIHERGNNSHQIWTVVANIQTAVASVLHRYYQVSPRLTSQSTVLINSIVTLNIVISDCTGCTFGLILFEKSLLFTKQNYCAAARNLFSP